MVNLVSIFYLGMYTLSILNQLALYSIKAMTGRVIGGSKDKEFAKSIERLEVIIKSKTYKFYLFDLHEIDSYETHNKLAELTLILFY